MNETLLYYRWDSSPIFFCEEIDSIIIFKAQLGGSVCFFDHSAVMQKATLAHLKIIFVAKSLQDFVEFRGWLNPDAHYLIGCVHFDINDNFGLFFCLIFPLHFLNYKKINLNK